MFPRALACLFVAIVFSTLISKVVAAGSPNPVDSDQAAIQEAANWIGAEGKFDTEYRYVMTCRVHLLLFWVGRDDVGGGYVRIGKAAGNDKEQMIQILFGSDPAKAPLSINRWGAGTELLRGDLQPPESAFFGFLKSSKGQSVVAMQREISREKNNGSHLFEGIISRVDGNRALSTTIPYTSSEDLDFRQYDKAAKAALQQLENNSDGKIRRLEGAARSGCPNTGQFLSTLLQLISDAESGHPMPETRCYIYNARHYKATLTSVHPVSERKVHVTLRDDQGVMDLTYNDLLEAHFEVLNEDTNFTNIFDILLGTKGNLRGAPIQIIYDPNWWFQIVLNLLPDGRHGH